VILFCWRGTRIEWLVQYRLPGGMSHFYYSEIEGANYNSFRRPGAKLFARIVRFEAALDRKARASTTSWAHIAHELGYFDQMHMIHDFAEFTGGTPTQMLREVEGLFRERVKAIRDGLCPKSTGQDLDMIL
jgi:AraC-like DNA-binding protein